ncbi:MAG: helix-turn-helix transcriptional regulator [Dokdonella sp.]|uniref:helix-turn-helix domain-containing protein n=1 Tax=Dokdonella sp. TaxID=2291710 RepID=UPI003BAF5DB6
MKVGAAIRMCRLRRQLSQGQLAGLAGCSVSYLSMIESADRDPTMSMVQKIADALRVPIEILFFLGADKGALSGIDKNLAGQLAITALDLLNEPAEPA